MKLVLGIAMLSAALGAARAQAPQLPQGEVHPIVRATAEAMVVASPDQAILDVGVVTEAPNAQAAAAQNAQKLERVLAALRKALGSGAEIKTIRYSVTPNYTYPREGGQPKISGYAANNLVQVKTGDLGKVGGVIDAATQAGANQVSGLRFGLKDDSAVRAQALKEAATKARAKADAIASALGVRIARVLSAEETGPVVLPMYGAEMAMRAGAADAPTPVEPGGIEIRASVTVTLEIAP